MKKIKVDQKTIKKYYDKACADVQAELRAEFPEVFKSEKEELIKKMKDLIKQAENIL